MTAKPTILVELAIVAIVEQHHLSDRSLVERRLRKYIAYLNAEQMTNKQINFDGLVRLIRTLDFGYDVGWRDCQEQTNRNV